MTKKKYWGKGRFKRWRDAAFVVVQAHPDGVSAARLLETVGPFHQSRTPSGVRQVTEQLKRDSRFDAFYPAKGSKSLSGQHYKVLQWVVRDDEE